VHREVIGELLQSSFAEAVTEKKLSPAGNPRIEPQSIDEGQDLRYTATFEVFPEVALQPMDSLELDRVTAEVTEPDIDAMILRLRKQQMRYSPAARAAASGDKVTIDFLGKIDGVEFAGGKGENVAIVLGERRMLPELEQGLIGAQAGEHRDVTVHFPADYRATELAGKAASFATDIKTVEEPALPDLDEEFCKDSASPRRSCEIARGRGRQHARELEPEPAKPQQDGGHGKALPGQSIDVPNALLESQIRDMQIDAMRRSGARMSRRRPRASRSWSRRGAASRLA